VTIQGYTPVLMVLMRKIGEIVKVVGLMKQTKREQKIVEESSALPVTAVYKRINAKIECS
jgi:hypothetical protein